MRLAALAERAIILVESDLSDLENIKCHGEGWVGEEGLLDVIPHMADDLYLGEVTKYHEYKN